MSAIETRGGVPFPISRTIVTGTNDSQIVESPGVTKFLQIYVTGAQNVRLYFHRTHYDADINFITLLPSVNGQPSFEGPVELPTERARSSGVFLRAQTSSSDATVVFYLRR